MSHNKRLHRLLGLCLLMLPWIAQAAALTPAEQKIQSARQAIAKSPARADGHNALALALARRARETADPAYYDQALQSLERSLEIAPDNYEALRNRVWVLLGKHEFAKALTAAKALNKRAPDDLMTYAFLVDAHIELGHYREAEEAAQWLLDLRPGNAPGLTRAAYLRELTGDPEGAIQLMEQAYQRTPASETEERAWILTQLAHLHLGLNRPEAAEALLTEALGQFPDYHYALAMQARLRQTQGRHREAAEILRRHYALAPHPENLYLLAVALERAGEAQAARRAYGEFETKAKAESASWDNANRELVHYYAEAGQDPPRALQIARLEISRRQDVFTLDAWAWALYRNQQLEQARRAIEQALAVGVRDPRLAYHAGAIALAQGDHAAARGHLTQCLQMAPRSEVADAARVALNQTEPTTPSPTASLPASVTQTLEEKP